MEWKFGADTSIIPQFISVISVALVVKFSGFISLSHIYFVVGILTIRIFHNQLRLVPSHSLNGFYSAINLIHNRPVR